MNRLLLLLTFSILILFNGYGQNSFFFNHYGLTSSYYNPAAIGLEEDAVLYALNRSQWVGYQATTDPGSAPTTQLVSFSIPSKINKVTGFGFSFVNDQVADFNMIDARFIISGELTISARKLHFGIAPGLTNRKISDNFRFIDPDDSFIPQSEISLLRPNLHLGLIYELSNTFNIGFSAENVIEPSFDFAEDGLNRMVNNFNFSAQKLFRITRGIDFQTTLLLRSDLKSTTFDISGMAYFQNRLWTGLNIKRSEAIGLLVGYSFLQSNKLSVGYSFDYVLVERALKQPTSHEIFLRYTLPNIVIGGRKAVKTPRFIF